MISLLLILVSFIGGLVTLLIKEAKFAKTFALVVSFIVLLLSIAAITTNAATQLQFDAAWLPSFGSRFTLQLDGMSKMLTLLTAIAFPIILIATYNNQYKNTPQFLALLLLTQTGLIGVFEAADCLLFYFFWELALIPVYFLCSIWGGEKRIQVTFKFFIYTFLGSLLMLAGIIYLYFQTPDASFALKSFYALHLTNQQQNIVFWLFFVAFAIKMPIFPFHTWQPDTYEQSPTAVTMVLSGVMVKMGIYATLRWLLPVFPEATNHFSNIIIGLSVTGMLYASLIAIKQDDLKRLIAYSSIAHIGLMCAAIFAQNKIGLNGVMIQMFNHGINVIGLWIVANAIEQQTGTRKLSELGGMAQKAPVLAILLVVLAFANIALPLTNAFIGEFLMFNGLFTYNVWMTAIAAISIILAAVYTLNMVQKIFYGSIQTATESVVDSSNNVKWVLAVLVFAIIVLGVFPQPIINLTKDTVNIILVKR
jgi:NADH-quinone oxidoreductase subunit M